MDYENRWESVRPLGEGGQGKVILVRPKGNLPSSEEMSDVIKFLTAVGSEERRDSTFQKFRQMINDIVRADDPGNFTALKVLHDLRDARDLERSNTRIVREIEVMSALSHPNLLKIIDSSPTEKWYVSEYHAKGVLSNHLNKFEGDLLASLKAIRPLVTGVAKLHRDGIVHRDIKPENIFISSEDNLILGDFGLVFFTDVDRTRISGTDENVGTRDWMPPWAMGQRINEIKPSFDVFSLGKVLWSMVSGKAFLRLWYFEDEEFNVEIQFLDNASMRFANPLFRRCIVEKEDQCLQNAGELLEELDRIITAIGRGGDVISPTSPRLCRVCGMGEYRIIVDRDSTAMYNFGIRPTGGRSLKIFACARCGHVQLFAFEYKKNLPAWSE